MTMTKEYRDLYNKRKGIVKFHHHEKPRGIFFSNYQGRWCLSIRKSHKAINWAVVVIENKLGREIKKGELVHHKDFDKTNDSPENLIICTRAEHARIHKLEEKTLCK